MAEKKLYPSQLHDRFIVRLQDADRGSAGPMQKNEQQVRRAAKKAAGAAKQIPNAPDAPTHRTASTKKRTL